MDPDLYPHLFKKRFTILKKLCRFMLIKLHIYLFIVMRAKKPSRTGQNMMMLKKTSVNLTVNISK